MKEKTTEQLLQEYKQLQVISKRKYATEKLPNAMLDATEDSIEMAVGASVFPYAFVSSWFETELGLVDKHTVSGRERGKVERGILTALKDAFAGVSIAALYAVTAPLIVLTYAQVAVMSLVNVPAVVLKKVEESLAKKFNKRIEKAERRLKEVEKELKARGVNVTKEDKGSER
ncbi:MAG: hypothetical protein J6T74_00600 [Clostridia bacterium]|nr:hypothetical protein [Clostridia bacterium]